MPNAVTTKRLAELRAAGASAAEAAAALAADPRFAKRIYAQLENAPDLRGLFAGTSIGNKLEDAAANEALHPSLRDGVRRVLRVVNWERGFLDTTNAQYAAELRQGLAGLVEAKVLTAPEAESLLALGGGDMLDRLTADEITAHWAAVDAAETEAALRADLAAAYSAVVAAVDGGEVNRSTLAALFTEVLEG